MFWDTSVARYAEDGEQKKNKNNTITASTILAKIVKEYFSSACEL